LLYYDRYKGKFPLTLNSSFNAVITDKMRHIYILILLISIVAYNKWQRIKENKRRLRDLQEKNSDIIHGIGWRETLNLKKSRTKDAGNGD